MKRLRILFVCFGWAAAVAMVAPSVQADDKPAASDPPVKKVEFFDAMKNGDVAVKFIPKNAKEANVIIENKANQPLAIKLPEAFAGVPVLAQFGGMGGGGMGGMGGMGGGGMGGGGMQGMGGGMGGMGGGGMGGGGMGGGGFFNVEPDKIRKIKVPCVCLEHGKTDPNPRVEYQILPIEQFTKDPKVIEVCKMLGYGQLPQNTAQAAAWHFTDGLSWSELASKDRVRLSNGYTEKYFAPQEIVFAMRAAAEAERRASERPSSDDAPASPGDQPAVIDSLSRN